MANADVKVKEIQLLEAYSGTYKEFMSATIAMTHRFRSILQQKKDEAFTQEHRIRDAANLIQQKMVQAKNALEAVQRRNRDDGGRELEQCEKAYKKFKELYKKAQQYEESGKKLQQKVNGEIDRVDYMNRRFRDRLEKSKADGENFLEKAINALNSYRQ